MCKNAILESVRMLLVIYYDLLSLVLNLSLDFGLLFFVSLKVMDSVREKEPLLKV